VAQFNWAYVDGNVISGSGGPDGAVQYRTGTRTISGSSRFTFATSSNTLEVTGTVNISGTLNVAGTTTTISASNLVIRDPIIGLGFGSGSTLTGAVGDRGLIFGLAGNLNQAILWDQTSASFVVGKVGTQGPHGTAYNIPGGDFSAFKVGSLKFIDNISGSGGITIEGESILKGALNVTGAATVKGGLSVTNASAISASGPMTIEGESILKGALNVTGAIASAASVTAGTSLVSSNTITGSGILTAGQVTGSAVKSLGVLSGSNLNINESKAVITTTGHISSSGPMTIEGESILKGALNVTGATTVKGGLSVTNASAISASGPMTIEMESILKGALNVTGAATVKGGLSITNASAISASGPMTIEGESILKGALNVTGAIASAASVTAGTSLASSNTITGSGVLTVGRVNTQLLSGSNLNINESKAVITTAGIISGSTISGALFVGGGSGLTDITSTWDGLRNGNASITGSLTVTTTITGSGILTAGQVTGSAVKSLGVLSGSNLNINESKTVISTAGHISSSGPMTIEGESILKGALNVTGAIESAGIITGNQVTGSNITALTSLISANIITGSGIITGNQVTGSNITALVGLISANTITGSGVLTAGQVNTQLLSGSNLSLFGGKALISTAGNLTAVSGTFSGDLICTGTLTLSGSDTTELLRLRKGTAQTREIVFENDGADAASIYLNNGENFFITNTAVGNNISFKCGANQILSIVGNGTKVGINNTSPDSALDVSASLGSTTAAIIEGDVMISGSISAVPNASFILASQVFS